MKRFIDFLDAFLTRFLILLMLLLVVVLLTRLYYLQVVEYQRYSTLSRDNRISLEDTVFAGALSEYLIETGYEIITQKILSAYNKLEVSRRDVL